MAISCYANALRDHIGHVKATLRSNLSVRQKYTKKRVPALVDCGSLVYRTAAGIGV
jgi:hypothetical protein